ncbi:MAG: radical SAM protein [Desulfobacterales bacterium]
MSGHRQEGLALDIALTARCPLRCRFCTVAKTPGAELTAAQWRGAMAALAALRPIRLISLEGGEPLLRPDMAEILRDSLGAADEVKVVTGGSVPLSGLPCDLTRSPRLTIEVSVDGPPAVHDDLRDGSWQAAWAFIDAARAQGVNLRLRSVVSVFNLGLLEEWLETVDRRLEANAPPVGYRFDTLIAPGALEALGGPVLRHPLRIYDSSGLIPSPEQVSGLFRRLVQRRFRRLRFEQSELFRGCGAGRTPQISFDPAGCFSFCCEAPRSFGSILMIDARHVLALLDAQMAALPCRGCRHFKQQRCDGCWTGQKCGMVSAWHMPDCRALLDSVGGPRPRGRRGAAGRRGPECAATPPTL